MEPELSAALIDAALELAGISKPADGQPSRPSPASPSERFGAHSVLSYAVAENADTYRRIMRILYLEHQAFGLRLRPAQIADRLRERYALTLDSDLLDERLGRLNGWGAVERDHDASLASTASEWRQNRFTYDVTSAGRLTEELLTQLDALGEEIGRLDGARLPSIRDALARLVKEMHKEQPEGVSLRSLFEHLLGEVEALHVGALSFMRSLSDLMRTVEHVGEEEFERGKGALLEHLQGFRRSRSLHSAEILKLLEQVDALGADALVSQIVAAEEFVHLPGGASIEDQRQRREGELLQRWRGLRAWFVGHDDSSSPWRALNDQVVDAIRAVLAIAERLIERRSMRVDRTKVLLHLASAVSTAPAGEASAWLRAAFGLRTPRHIGVQEPDPEQVVDRGRTSWMKAPPAPVVAYLRTPGARTPGSGSGSPVPDLGGGRERFAQRRQAEREELEMLLSRLRSDKPMRISTLQHAEAHELRHLLSWIGRAYETPAGRDGTRHASSLDGRTAIVLHPPSNVQEHRAKLRVPHGTLDLPDFAIEVITR